MPRPAHLCVATALAILALSPALHTQIDSDAEPRIPVLTPRPQSPRDEALALYARGLLYQQCHCLVEAAKVLERAANLDPKAACIQRGLFPIYMALERRDDALAACHKALALDPEDSETWFLLALQFRLQDRPRDALDALVHGAASPRLPSRPELALQLYRDLAALQESFHQYDEAAVSLTAAVLILDDPEPLVERGDIDLDEIKQHAADLYERLGRVCTFAKQNDRAILAFEKACDKDPNRQHRLAYNLVDVYLAREDVAKALNCLDTYLQSQPQGTEAYEQKARLLKQLGRQDEIVPSFESYVSRDPNNVALRLLLGRELARAGYRQRAVTLFRELASQSPTAEIYRSWFSVYREQGAARDERILRQLDEALAATGGELSTSSVAESASHARAMLGVLREDPALVKELLPVVRHESGHLANQTRLLFGMLALRDHQLDLAEELYRSCLTRPGDAKPSGEPEAYAGLLRALWLTHQYAPIVEVCRQGLEHSSAGNPVLFRVDLARALVALGQFEEAIRQADGAVAAAGERERFFVRRARALVFSQAERYDAAAAECQALLNEFKDPAQVRDVRYTLSSIWSQAKNSEKSEEQLKLILEADANDASANNDLGYLWADQNKNLEEAERMIRKALSLDKDQRTPGETAEENAAYVDSLGWVLFRRGQLDAARREMEKAATLPDGVDDPVVSDHLGDVCLKMNDQDRAAVAFRRAIELFETGHTRRPDDRYEQIKAKRKLLP